MSQAHVTDVWHMSSIGNYGRIVSGITCPLCGDKIIYNGNYFCSDFSCNISTGSKSIHYGGECMWALPHPATSKIDRGICDALGISYD